MLLVKQRRACVVCCTPLKRGGVRLVLRIDERADVGRARQTAVMRWRNLDAAAAAAVLVVVVVVVVFGRHRHNEQVNSTNRQKNG